MPDDGGFHVDIQLDMGPYLRAMRAFARKQVPFATALALTKTAQAAQDHLARHLVDDFTVRKQWVPRSIQIDPARKGDLEAEVGSVSDFMPLHALGKTREPAAGRRMLAMPIGARRSETKAITTGMLPGAILKKDKFFSGDIKGVKGIYKRLGRGGRKLKLMYAYEPKLKIPRRWEFAQQVESVVRREWPLQWVKAMEKATRGK